MLRFCQVFRAFFTPAMVVLPACASALPLSEPLKTPQIEVLSWSARPFAAVSLDTPDLAACFLLAPGTWPLVHAPKQQLEPEALARAVETRLAGLLDFSGGERIVVIETGVERNAASAVAHDTTVLLMLPDVQSVDTQQVAGVVAEAVVASRLRPAPPDRRCSEPLLQFSEALARAGVLALAGLPPSLRPVSDWLEPREAKAAIEAVARDAFDLERQWADRRAALAQASRAGNLRPELAHAAAMLVETLGSPKEALAHPLDLLLTWRDQGNPKLPSVPSVVRKALANPLQAGVPKKKEKERAEQEELAASVTERALRSGVMTPAALPPELPVPALLDLAAALRATGSPELCTWVRSAKLPADRFTGCREEEPAGVVFARPRPAGGFEVVWRGAAQQENSLLIWPRWLLFPRIDRNASLLRFIDDRGVWELHLDGSPPSLLLPGAFRQLGTSPSGNAIAAARRGAPVTVVRLANGTTRELSADAEAGLAFVDSDIVATGSDGKVGLASVEGSVRAGVLEVGCLGALAARPGSLLAAVLPPCEVGLYRLSVAEGTATLVLKMSEGAASIALLADGVVVLATSEGLFRWREGSAPERFATGLTPGPG
jgi:hypothetical protein